jgi:polyketide biosynthesis acyl carrier protein
MSEAEIIATIVRHAQRIVPQLEGYPFKATDSLRELGANSVDRADIIMMTLETLALNIPLSIMAKAENIGELASIIHEKS